MFDRNTRPKIAIVMDKMSIGGIPKACATFVNQLSQYCDVTMVMLKTDEPLMDLLPSNVRVIKLKHLMGKDVIKKLLLEHKMIKLVSFIIRYTFWSRIKKNSLMTFVTNIKEFGCQISDEYDCAIAYHGMDIEHLSMALYSIKAKKTVAWIHGEHPFNGKVLEYANNVYLCFDKIYCVSPNLKQRFLSSFPNLSKRVDTYLNILDVSKIRELSNDTMSIYFSKKNVNIVTVGRLSEVKGQEMVPEIIKILTNRGINLVWYLVGDGPTLDNIKKKSLDQGVWDYIEFLGAKTNPYPYIKNCDIYVQPSFSEGYCLTVCEAAILNKPIVLTEIAAKNILENNISALVTKPEPIALADAIETLITNLELRDNLVKNTEALDLSNSKEIEKFLKFLIK